VVNATPRPLYPRDRPGTNFIIIIIIIIIIIVLTLVASQAMHLSRNSVATITGLLAVVSAYQ
jgi:uncharacterized protein YqhQ